MADADVNMSIRADVVLHKEKIKPGMVVKKSKIGDNLIAPREGVYCWCVMDPLWTPRHSGRYPWKDEDNEIREVFNMNNDRLNRFASMINAAGGYFRINDAIGERPTAHIDIPCDMLSHLHIDGDGSIGLLKKVVTPKIPAVSNIQTFNDRAVQITFADGTQTKCVCGKGETFDLYEGIAFCLFKRFLDKDKGHKHFNDLMRYAFKKLDEQEKAKEREAKIKAENKRHEEKKKLQAQRRKARKREEKIGIFAEGVRRANGLAPDLKAEHVKKIEEQLAVIFDPLSGRTFTSSKENILLAVTRINNQIINSGWVSVNDWYEELGLDCVGTLGNNIGWNLDHQIKIDFVPDTTGDGRNCLAIVYAEKPVRFEEGKA